MTPTGARPLRRDARDNREALLAAAREVFAADGLEASLEEIARRAGVSIGTLYNRFGSRTELADAALCRVVEEATTLAERGLADGDPWRGLVGYLTGIGELQSRDRGFTEVCVLTLPPGSATERAKARGKVVVAELVERAHGSGVLRADVDLTDLVLLLSSVVRATEGIRDTAPDAWRRHLAILLDGLRPDAAHPLPGGPLDADAVHASMRFG